MKGITVVSIEQAVAAPFATRQLADLGARVIKIERPEGDFARRYDQAVKGLSSHFVWLNRDKESLALDLKKPGSMEVLRKLLQGADVFVQNLAPGAIERLGLNPDELEAVNPRLIACSLSGYGRTGPYRLKKAYDLLIQAESGLLHVTGTPDTPVKVGISVADIAAGMYAFAGILAGLYQRERTGKGFHFEVSMLESLAEWMGYPLYYGAYGGEAPPRTGAHHSTIAPYGPFPVAGGQTLFVAVQNEREWVRFCQRVLENPSLAEDPRFSSNPARVKHRPALEAVIREVFSSLTLEKAVNRLEDAGIAYAEMRTIQGVWDHPQLEARQRWTKVGSPAGDLRVLVPPLLSPEEASFAPIPEVGAHTEAILRELGYSDEEIRQLEASGAVGRERRT
ncbi:MAG: CoA transferase [Clostridiales bacterium]|nr:CoA transferase [Clostridiales bacterium]